MTEDHVLNNGLFDFSQTDVILIIKNYYFWFNKYTKLPFRGSVSNQNVVNSYFTLLPSEKLI